MNPRKRMPPQLHDARRVLGQPGGNSAPSSPRIAPPKMATSSPIKKPCPASSSFHPRTPVRTAQAKPSKIAQNWKHPTTPPAYHPQPVKVLQKKIEQPYAGRPLRHPVAPPVYRPQPTPRVLQAKIALGQLARRPDQARPRPVAPPVYRPGLKVLQQQIGPGARIPRQQVATAPPLKGRPVAPPVYRPQLSNVSGPKSKNLLQAKTGGAALNRRQVVGPSVYRPQPAPRVLQGKIVSHLRPQACQHSALPAAPPVYPPARHFAGKPNLMGVRSLMSPKLPPPYQPGAPVIQRKVWSRKNKKGKTVYYSDQDPEQQEFDTSEEAEIRELSLGLSRVNDGTRGPTLYQFTHTKSHCQISPLGVGQGPHSLGFAAVDKALQHASQGQSIRAIFSEQVPPPGDWKRMIVNEKGKDVFNGKDEFTRRLVRALEEYTALYLQTEFLIKLGKNEDALGNISRLMQLGAYTTFCWKSDAKASKKSLDGSGETSDIMLDSNIDTGGRWRNKEAYKKFIEDRRGLLDDDYNMDEESDTYERVLWDGQPLYFSHDEIRNWGDCFFDTLLALGVGNGNSVQQLRQLAAANGGQANIANNNGPRIWANHQDITALANHFGVRIRVLSLSIWDNSVVQETTYGAAGPTHLIAQIHGGHFTPLYDQAQ